jgi:hypothetical protein
VDGQRYQELMRKRQEGGLTDEEANELGRLMAEKDGRAQEGEGTTSDQDEGSDPRAEVHDTRLSRERSGAWERDKRA